MKLKTSLSPWATPLLIAGLALPLVLLKLAGLTPVATWSWWWVWAPAWVTFLVLLVVGLLIVYAVKRANRQA